MKGQLFTMDVLASVLIVTIIVAFTTWEFEQIYSRSSDVQYEKISSLANDIAQMAAKNILANRSDGKVLPNWVDPARWGLLTGNMSQMIPLTSPYAYSANIIHSGLSATGNGGCGSRSNVAVSRRIVYINGAAEELNIKVCL